MINISTYDFQAKNLFFSWCLNNVKIIAPKPLVQKTYAFSRIHLILLIPNTTMHKICEQKIETLRKRYTQNFFSLKNAKTLDIPYLHFNIFFANLNCNFISCTGG